MRWRNTNADSYSNSKSNTETAANATSSAVRSVPLFPSDPPMPRLRQDKSVISEK